MGKKFESYRHPISAWGYFGFRFLYAIPVIGFFALLINTFRNRNINSRNFARSYWCVLLIRVIVTVLLVAACLVGLSVVKDEEGTSLLQHIRDNGAAVGRMFEAASNGDTETAAAELDSLISNIEGLKPEIAPEAAEEPAPAEETEEIAFGGQEEIPADEEIAAETEAPVEEAPVEEEPVEEAPVEEEPVAEESAEEEPAAETAEE